MGYRVREARAAGQVIELARRAAAPPSWLAPHTSRITAVNRDAYLVEAEATLARVHGFLLIPYMVQTQEYFREVGWHAANGDDVDADWDLLSARQAHRPAGVTRLLEVIIDESALVLRTTAEVMAGQLRHLLALADSAHATARVIPDGAPYWPQCGHNFDVLPFAGTEDRIGVCYLPVIGAEIDPSGKACELWTHIESTLAVGLTQSWDILGRHLPALT